MCFTVLFSFFFLFRFLKSSNLLYYAVTVGLKRALDYHLLETYLIAFLN